MRRLYRAINGGELANLLRLNHLNDKGQLQIKNEYLFAAEKDSRWSDRRGLRKHKLYDIANQGTGIILQTWVFSSAFEENKGDEGKYYCRATHQRKVKIVYLKR